MGLLSAEKIQLSSSEVGLSDRASRAILAVGRRACGTALRLQLGLLEGEAETLTRKAIELALAGDTTVMRLCLERAVPPRRDRPIRLALPVINSADDATQARGFRIVAAAGAAAPDARAVGDQRPVCKS
jgi:hypothetical protein